MSDDRSMKRSLSLSSLLTGAHLSPRKGVPALNFPHLHLCADTKNNYASGDSSTATATTRESSTSTTTNASAEAESPTSSTIWDLSSSSALDPPSSPVRIPARLRRKCPMYAQFHVREDHSGASTASATPVVSTTVPGKDVAAAKIEPTFDRGGTPAPTARTSPVIIMVPSPKRRAEQAAQRKRIPPPVPVPHLIKKSRGRRVPEPDQARERAHVCTVPGCSKSFARAEHLKRHVISLHTHEKRKWVGWTHTQLPFLP
jgi:hypothetical protein